MHNPWLHLPATPPYILPRDWPAVQAHNQTAPEELVIQTDSMPEPFTGNPFKASVIFLGLNPGHGPDDAAWYQKRETQTQVYRNLRLQTGFWLLEDREGPGWAYWSQAAREIIEIVGHEIFVEKVAAIEFYPYHTVGWGALPASVGQSFSMWLLREALLLDPGKVLVATKRQSDWQRDVGPYNVDGLRSPQAGRLSRRNLGDEGFDAVIAKLTGK